MVAILVGYTESKSRKVEEVTVKNLQPIALNQFLIGHGNVELSSVSKAAAKIYPWHIYLGLA